MLGSAVSFTEYIYWRFIAAGTAEVRFTPAGGLAISAPNRGLRALVALPASTFWLDTGFVIPAKSKARIRVSGRVHLALQYLVSDTWRNRLPRYIWNGPEGTEWIGGDLRSNLRKELLICPRCRVGTVLAYLQTMGPPPGPSYPRPSENGLYHIGKSSVIQNSSDQDARIWLTVNDLYLWSEDLERAKDAFLPRKKHDKYNERLERWNAIVDNNYWRVWYDDNIGSFSVSIEEL